MPAITPNLLLIDADVAAGECASTIMTDFSGQLMLARDSKTAVKILSEHLIDLIILDRNAIGPGQQLDAVVAQFHNVKSQHDVPVLITCVTPQRAVCLKAHPWGVAYHVHKTVDPMVLKGLIQGSLALKVCYGPDQNRHANPKPFRNRTVSHCRRSSCRRHIRYFPAQTWSEFVDWVPNLLLALENLPSL